MTAGPQSPSVLRAQVERFYRDIWDRHDGSVIPEVLATGFTFRGSLGDEKRGHAGFADYVDAVHGALAGYRCVIDDLVVEPPKAFARMSFRGRHVGEFLGYAPTGKAVRWAGAALFEFEAEKIARAWVLGDLHGLDRVLRQNAT